MNRWLANSLGSLNAFLAVSCILVSVVSGGLMWSNNGGAVLLGLGLGSIVGIVIAIVVFGFIALLIDIRDLLIELRDK